MTANERQAIETEDLRQRLEEAEATLEAIRNGLVDAVVVASPENGQRVYTLEGADHSYRTLVESMQQGAVTLAADGTVLYSNRSFAAMVQRPQETVTGGSFFSFCAECGDRLLQEVLDSPHVGGRQQEARLERADGTTLPVWLVFNTLRLSGALAVCVIVTDLTERKQHEELQVKDRRKDEFLAMLAHELRNPLAPIASAVHVLRIASEGADAKVGWACGVVDRQLQQMTRIIDDLLDVSRITRGKIQLQMAPVDLSAVVSRAVETSRPTIEARRHTLQIVIPPGPLKVEGDVTRLAQALTNLLNNAAKYTEEGGTITLEVVSEGGDVLLKVRDTGVGLAADFLPTVFDLFMQADRSLDRAQGGLGIGLTLVKRLVEMHRGSVTAKSEGAGKGSEFTIRLPLLLALPPPEIVARPDASGQSARQRILVVDDNQDAANTLAVLLNLMGHEAKACHDGPAALALAPTFLPTLVLLDIGLPGMNGYRVAEELRKRCETRAARLVALTGYGSDEDRRLSSEAGFDGHLVKPINPATLEDLVGTASVPAPARRRAAVRPL